MEFLRTYFRALRGSYRRALSVVLLGHLSGTLEIAGLLLLVSLLEGAVSKANLLPIASSSGQLAGMRLVLSPAAAIGLFLGLGVFAALAKLGSHVFLNQLTLQCEDLYRRKLIWKLFGMDWQHFVSLKSGRINELVLRRGREVAWLLTNFIELLEHSVLGAVYVAVALWLSPLPALIVMIVFAGGWILTARLGSRCSNRTRLPLLFKEVGYVTSQFLNNLKFVRSSGDSARALTKFDSALSNYQYAIARSYLFRHFPAALVEFGGLLFIGLVLIASVVYSFFSVGRAVALLAVFYRLIPRFKLAMGHYMHLRECEPVARDFLGEIERICRRQAPALGDRRPLFSRELRLENVGFRYRNNAGFVLQGIEFVLKPGRCIALVGPSGCGKSTVVDLVTGLLAPVQGKILIDGIDLKAVDVEFWRRQVGLVLQNVPIFHASATENIAWNADEIDMGWVEACARMANAWSFIQSWPQGFRTTLGQKGMRLSGGEQQRIALARALYRRPRLLILDEATNSMDSLCESLVFERLGQLRAQLAVLIVTHRLKTASLADEILVLEGGRAVERGTWDALVSAGNTCLSQMVRRQDAWASA